MNLELNNAQVYLLQELIIEEVNKIKEHSEPPPLYASVLKQFNDILKQITVYKASIGKNL